MSPYTSGYGTYCILQIAFWLETCRAAPHGAMKKNTWHMWVSVKSGLCEYVRPLGVWWSFTFWTLQLCLCYINQTGLRVIWQRWHTCWSEIHTCAHTQCRLSAHPAERETWQRKVSRDLSYLIPSLHLSLSFLFSLIIHSLNLSVVQSQFSTQMDSA